MKRNDIIVLNAIDANQTVQTGKSGIYYDGTNLVITESVSISGDVISSNITGTSGQIAYFTSDSKIESSPKIVLNSNDITFNSDNSLIDFIINKDTSGIAYQYKATNDEHQFNSDILISTDGSTNSNPRLIGFNDLTSNEACRVNFGDNGNAWQNGHSRAMQMWSYHTLILQGDRNTTVPLSYVTDSNLAVRIVGSDNEATPILDIKKGNSSNTYYTTWRDENDSLIAQIDANGNLILESGYIEVPELSGAPVPSTDKLHFFGLEENGKTQPVFQFDDGQHVIPTRDSFKIIRNTSGSTIAKGKLVHIIGSTGSTANISGALASSLSFLPTIGFTFEEIDNNNFGRVMFRGILSDIDTSAFSEGDTLYLSATQSGEFTNVEPKYPNYSQPVGIVLSSGVGNGSILVDIEDAATKDGSIGRELLSTESISGAQNVLNISLKTLISIQNVHSYSPPVSGFATIDTRNTHKVLDFDDTTNETAIFELILPRSYTGNGVEVIPHFSMTSATSGDVVIETSFERVGEVQNVDIDNFATAQSATITVPGTNGLIIASTSITHTDGSQMDNVAVGEKFRLRIVRNSESGSDTATGDLELHAIEIKEV